MRTNLTVAAALLFSCAAANTAEHEFENRELYARCASVGMLVEELPSTAKGIGLSKAAIESAVESRLRGARLFESDTVAAGQWLYINANVVSRAFAISVDLRRVVTDTGFGRRGTVAVWDVGSAGTHGNDGQYILSSLSGHMDAFLTKYLRANDAWCRMNATKDYSDVVRVEGITPGRIRREIGDEGSKGASLDDLELWAWTFYGTTLPIDREEFGRQFKALAAPSGPPVKR